DRDVGDGGGGERLVEDGHGDGEAAPRRGVGVAAAHGERAAGIRAAHRAGGSGGIPPVDSRRIVAGVLGAAGVLEGGEHDAAERLAARAAEGARARSHQGRFRNVGGGGDDRGGYAGAADRDRDAVAVAAAGVRRRA